MNQETKLDFTELQQFLEQSNIPQIKGNPTTFLGIARQPHYENVLSNIYAFYFNPNAEHGLQELFTTGLLDCIKRTTLGANKDFSNFSDYIVETESSTNKGGRIDLLLDNGVNAIIIENKMYHTLNNDLQDYWDTLIKEIKDENRLIGIVLSLKETPNTGHKQFINITHTQLLEKVMANIGSYLLEASDKYLVFLKDLHQNIINLSRKIMNENDFTFYFHNQEKINQLVTYRGRILEHLKKEVEQAGKSIKGCVVKSHKSGSNSESRFRYFASKKNPDLMLTVVFERLMKADKKLAIIIELQGKALTFRNEIDSSKYKAITSLSFNTDFTTTKNTYAHFAHKWYSPSEGEIYQLSDFIIKRLEEDKFMDIFRELDRFLSEKRDKKVN